MVKLSNIEGYIKAQDRWSYGGIKQSIGEKIISPNTHYPVVISAIGKFITDLEVENENTTN